jgi:RND family efflux transporter MFP subunit
MRSFLRVLIPILIFSACAGTGWWLYVSRPVPPAVQTTPALVRVEGTVLKVTSHPVLVKSQGTVRPRTQSTIVPEVSAKVIEVNPSFRPGGFFEKDEVLLKLDPVDYETAVVIAKANVAQAEALLIEERAKAEQALENWKALGRTGDPGALVLRQPHVAKAEADAESAKAQVLKAERDLERTVIRAPYAGQVLEQLVDVGQYVTPGTQLAKVFAVDYVEIRLPLPEQEMRFLDLPESHRGSGTTENAPAPKVHLNASVGGRPAVWEGRIVRVESAMDASTRQVVAVAQVDDPYAPREDGAPPLKIGQFAEAEIAGDVLENVFVIPRRAVRAGNEIILITPQNTLRRVIVEPLFSDAAGIVVAAGKDKSPKEGDVLCLTPIPFPADGARVLPTIDGQTEAVGMAKSGPQAAKPAQTGGKPRAS